VSEPSPSFERDIGPLFRTEDVESMLFAFDLRSYDDVRENADEILERLEEGSMPCDELWPQTQIERFRAWIAGGMQP
jgi:hypothetical protein